MRQGAQDRGEHFQFQFVSAAILGCVLLGVLGLVLFAAADDLLDRILMMYFQPISAAFWSLGLLSCPWFAVSSVCLWTFWTLPFFAHFYGLFDDEPHGHYHIHCPGPHTHSQH